MNASNVGYLKELARRAQRLVKSPPTDDLEYFRSVIIKDPDRLRRTLLGANALRFKELTPTQRACARVLDVSPDLLSPLGELRYEPSHSKLIGYFLAGKQHARLAHRCRESLLRVLNIEDEVLEVTTEHTTAKGRVDVCISMKETLLFIELKVDAAEGPAQLKGYRQVLQQKSGSRRGVLAYLSLGAGGEKLSCEPDRRLSFEELLQAWLPHAVGDRTEQEYLARYLKSIALLVGVSEPGGFYDWSFATQRACVTMLEEVIDEQN